MSDAELQQLVLDELKWSPRPILQAGTSARPGVRWPESTFPVTSAPSPEEAANPLCPATLPPIAGRVRSNRARGCSPSSPRLDRSGGTSVALSPGWRWRCCLAWCWHSTFARCSDRVRGRGWSPGDGFATALATVSLAREWLRGPRFFAFWMLYALIRTVVAWHGTHFHLAPRPAAFFMNLGEYLAGAAPGLARDAVEHRRGRAGAGMARPPRFAVRSRPASGDDRGGALSSPSRRAPRSSAFKPGTCSASPSTATWSGLPRARGCRDARRLRGAPSWEGGRVCSASCDGMRRRIP